MDDLEPELRKSAVEYLVTSQLVFLDQVLSEEAVDPRHMQRFPYLLSSQTEQSLLDGGIDLRSKLGPHGFHDAFLGILSDALDKYRNLDGSARLRKDLPLT